VTSEEILNSSSTTSTNFEVIHGLEATRIDNLDDSVPEQIAIRNASKLF
jgi:hypothetical protein